MEQAIAGLKARRGDLGIQSGLIATNLVELATLRRLGERYYVEFLLAKGGPPQGVEGLQLLLRKSDLEQCTFDLDATVDGQAIAKKDKKLNEPVQFLLASSHQPYVLVVNEITANSIAGYLDMPKDIGGPPVLSAMPNIHTTQAKGDGESIPSQIARIRKGQHLALPAPVASRPAVGLSPGFIQRTVENGTAYTLTVLFGGPVERRIVMAPGGVQQLLLPAGSYEVAARVSAPNVLPFFGVQSYPQGQAYTSRFYVR